MQCIESLSTSFDFRGVLLFCIILALCASPFDFEQWLTESYVLTGAKKKIYLWEHQIRPKGKTCSILFRCNFMRTNRDRLRLSLAWLVHSYACVCGLLDRRWNYHNVLHLFSSLVRTKGNNHQIQWRKCAQMNTYSLFKALCVTVFFLSLCFHSCVFAHPCDDADYWSAHFFSIPFSSSVPSADRERERSCCMHKVSERMDSFIVFHWIVSWAFNRYRYIANLRLLLHILSPFLPLQNGLLFSFSSFFHSCWTVFLLFLLLLCICVYVSLKSA